MLIRRLSIVCWLLLAVIGCQSSKEPESSAPEQRQGMQADKSSDLPAVKEVNSAESETERPGAEMASSGQDTPPVDSDLKEGAGSKTGSENKELSGSKRGAGSKQPPELPDSEPALSTVRSWLLHAADPSSPEKTEALESLDVLGEQAVQQASRVLSDDDPAARRAAASYLVGRVSMRNKQVIRTLAETLASDDAELRHRSFLALERLPRQALGTAVPELAILLNNPKEEEIYRVRVARLLGRLPEVGRQATPALRQAASKQASLRVRRAALAALAKVGDRGDAEDVFLKILQSDDPADLRGLAASWLARVAQTEKGLQGLIAALDDPEPTVRKAASEGLVAIGKPAVPALIAALDSASAQQRRFAIFALGKMGPLAAGATTALKKQAADPNPEIQRLAKAALGLVQRP